MVKSSSSSRWISRQLKDHYVKSALTENTRSRSFYKLLEIENCFSFVQKSKGIICDVGSAPGGWSLACLAIKGQLKKPQPLKMISIDLLPMEPIHNTVHANPKVENLCYFIQDDFLKESTKKKIKSIINHKINSDDNGDNYCDLIVSDMLHNMTGQKQRDHDVSMNSTYELLDFCDDILHPHGNFVCKVLMGGGHSDLMERAKESFKKVSVMKPQASRKESVEMFLIGKNKLTNKKR